LSKVNYTAQKAEVKKEWCLSKKTRNGKKAKKKSGKKKNGKKKNGKSLKAHFYALNVFSLLLPVLPCFQKLLLAKRRNLLVR
jgi:hypothetical protein